jgi:hypothetical protein
MGGAAALVASSRCRGVLAVRNLAKSITTSKTITTVGEVDFNFAPIRLEKSSAGSDTSRDCKKKHLE